MLHFTDSVVFPSKFTYGKNLMFCSHHNGNHAIILPHGKLNLLLPQKCCVSNVDIE